MNTEMIAEQNTNTKKISFQDVAECFALPEYNADPFPFFKYFRENKPVYYSEATQAWHFFRYEDVWAIYKDKRFGRGDNSYASTLGEDAGRSIGRWMQWRQGKEHVRIRQVLQEPFNKTNTMNMAPAIERAVDSLLQNLPEEGSFDIFNEYFYKLPVLIICDMLGIPREDFGIFVNWSKRLSSILDPNPSPEQIRGNNSVILEAEAYFKPLFAKKAANPGSDVISKLMLTKDTPNGMTEEDIMSHIIMLFFAGHETTTNQMGFGIYDLLTHRDQWGLLRQSEAHYDTAIEEMLRYNTSVVFIQYRTQEDLVFAGQSLPKNTCVWVFLPSANRDAKAFVNADNFDITRVENPHVAFGKSVHQCLGADLSRLEMKIAFQRLIQKLKGRDLELESFKPRPSLFIRGPEEIRVKIV